VLAVTACDCQQKIALRSDECQIVLRDLSGPRSYFIRQHSATRVSVNPDVSREDQPPLLVAAAIGLDVDIVYERAATATLTHPRSHERRLSERVHTIVFTDIVGSTATLELLGDEAAVGILSVHNRLVRRLAADSRGVVIKNTGDGFMLDFDVASDAIGFSLALHTLLASYTEGHPGRGIQVRIGIHAGPAMAVDGDLLGLAVNIASRLCDRAEPGGILASEGVRHLASGSAAVFIVDEPLTGLIEPVRVYRVAQNR